MTNFRLLSCTNIQAIIDHADHRASGAAMPEYIYIIHPFRHGFFESPTPKEAVILDEHFHYLQLAAKAGTVLLAGPCTDDTFGLVIFRAANEDAARAFMFNDPSVKNNVMVAELHPMHISIQG
jgi:uncharacterized protein YciI